jgi:bleomycin hydrolase
LNTHDLAPIAPTIEDGGNFVKFRFLVEKYGLVPKSAMPETKSSGATARLDAEINYSLGITVRSLVSDALRVAKEGGISRAADIREEGMARLMKILSAHLGTPPTRFDYAAEGPAGRHGRRSYTPQGFVKDFVGFKFDDYVQVGSWPFQKRDIAYEADGGFRGAPAPGKLPLNYRFVNVDVERLEHLATAALASGKPVYIYVAMSKDVDNKTGIMHPKIYDRQAVYGLSRQERTQNLSRAQSASLGLNGGNHLMVLTGFDRPDPNGPVVKFRVENSWGQKSGDHGVYHMYREWFREHAYSIIVPKSVLSTAELKAWKSKARQLN